MYTTLAGEKPTTAESPSSFISCFNLASLNRSLFSMEIPDITSSILVPLLCKARLDYHDGIRPTRASPFARLLYTSATLSF